MDGVNNNNIKTNYSNRFAIILSIALIVNLAFYWLPDSILNIPIKKVDLLSDIRIYPEKDINDLLALLEEYEEDDEVGNEIDQAVVTSDSTLSSGDRTQQNIANAVHEHSDTATTDSTVNQAAKLNNKTASAFEDEKNKTNYLHNTDIEDFTSERTGLSNFFSALNNIDNLGRPVRIAFVGDSFIEGDILVADFRARMQEHFGGKGVGFIPIESNVSQFRTTIKQSANGWNTYSIIKNKSRKYVISGMQFEPTSNNASVNIQTTNTYPGLEEVPSLKFIYSKNENTSILLKSNTDTTLYELPPTENIMLYEIKSRFSKGTLQLKDSQGLNAIGMAIEDNHGVIVDNLALRGNSGIIMSELDSKSCRDLQHIRPYDLIVLQYGLNVASDSVLEYGWYRNSMIPVVEHVQNCFPGADILILGVSDRSHKDGNTYSTMPAILSLLRAQRQTAIRTEVTFWSTFAAMGGYNSMVKYVDSNWASKDYTHLSFRGGREIANALYEAIINEKIIYDNDEEYAERE